MLLQAANNPRKALLSRELIMEEEEPESLYFILIIQVSEEPTIHSIQSSRMDRQW
jgi:hypothetical protein